MPDDKIEGKTVVKGKKKAVKKRKSLEAEEATVEEDDVAQNEEIETKEKKKRKRKRENYGDHIKTIDMVIEAIQELKGDGRSIASAPSVLAIRAYILSHFSVSESMLNSMLRRAMKTGLDSDILARPKTQEKLAILSGRYLISNKKELEDKKSAVPRARPAGLRQLKPATKGKKKKKKRVY